MHDHSGHHHTHPNGGHALWSALVITLVYAVIEAIAGWWAGSLALLGDAGHMLSDAAALGLAAAAAWFARRPPSPRHSYGFGRIEVVAALANGLFMLLIVAGIVSSAVQRLQNPAPVSGGTVTMVAALGLMINVTVIVMLSRGESTLNTRGAMLHVFGDLLGSVAALLSGMVISLSGWTPIDPILSLLICTLIVLSSLRLLRDALHVVMEGVPAHLSLTDVGRAMSKRGGVLSIHDLHIWTLSSGHVALSAHVVVADLAEWETLLLDLKTVLRERFHIEHTTLQPEPGGQVLARVPLENVRRERAPETTEAQ